MAYGFTTVFNKVPTKATGSSDVATQPVNASMYGAETAVFCVRTVTSPAAASVFTLQHSPDGRTWANVPSASLTGPGVLAPVDVKGYTQLRIRLATPESAAGSVDLTLRLERRTSPMPSAPDRAYDLASTEQALGSVVGGGNDPGTGGDELGGVGLQQR